MGTTGWTSTNNVRGSAGGDKSCCTFALGDNTKRGEKNARHQIEENYHSGTWDEAYCQRKVLPLLAFTQHAETLAWRKKIILPEHSPDDFDSPDELKK
jgi:hypothetical protein